MLRWHLISLCSLSNVRRDQPIGGPGVQKLGRPNPSAPMVVAPDPNISEWDFLHIRRFQLTGGLSRGVIPVLCIMLCM